MVHACPYQLKLNYHGICEILLSFMNACMRNKCAINGTTHTHN